MRTLGVLLAALLLAGCSGQAVDTDEIEATIAKQMRDQIDGNPNVACPDGLDWQTGGEFHCIAKVDGQTARVTVTMENDTDWTWKVD
jgi:hypothetical protein